MIISRYRSLPRENLALSGVNFSLVFITATLKPACDLVTTPDPGEK